MFASCQRKHNRQRGGKKIITTDGPFVIGRIQVRLHEVRVHEQIKTNRAQSALTLNWKCYT